MCWVQCVVLHSSLGWFIWTQHIIQLTVGVLAQLVERCTGIAGFKSCTGLIFFRSYFQLLVSVSSVISCEDLLILCIG